MSPSDGGSEVKAQSSARKLAAIVGLFMAIGPPIGGVTWVIVASVGELIARKQLNLEALTRFVQELSYIFPAMPLSYRFGLLPAALAGIIVGTAQLKYGRLALPVGLVIGAAVGVVFYFSIDKLLRLPKIPPTLFSLGVGLMICVLSTFVCWEVVQNWYVDHRSPEQCDS